MAAGALVLAVGAAAAAALLLGGEDELPRGPLGTDDITGMSAPQQVGRPFSIGLPVVYNRGDEPATLEKVSLIEKTPGIEVVEALANGVDRKFLYNAVTYKWPAPRTYTDLHPVRGYVVPPMATPEGDRGVELVFVLRVDAPGEQQFTGVHVDYRIGTTRYRTVLWQGARICAMRELPKDPPPCKPVDLSGKSYD